MIIIQCFYPGRKREWLGVGRVGGRVGGWVGPKIMLNLIEPLKHSPAQQGLCGQS